MSTTPAPAPSPAAQTVPAPAPVAPAPAPASKGQQGRAVVRDALAKAYAGTPATPEPTKVEKKVEAAAPAPAVEPAKAPVVPTPEPKKPASLLSRKAEAAPAPKVEPAPAAAPAVEPASELPEELPKDVPEPTRVNWKKSRELERQLKGQVTEANHKMADLQKQIDTYKAATPADVAEMQRLKDEHKALSDRLAVVDLQYHPDFKRQYVEPQQAALRAASEVLAYNSKEGVDLGAMLAKPQKDFNADVAKLTEGMNSMDATTVQTSLRQAFTLRAQQQAALAKSSEVAQGLAQRAAAESKQTFEEVWGKLSGPDGFLVTVTAADDASPEEKESVTRYNQAVTNVRTAAEQNAFGQLTPQKGAALAGKAAVLDFLQEHGLPRMEAEYRRLLEHDRQVTARLAEITKARSTGPAAGDPAAGGGGGGGPPKNETPAQAFKRLYRT